MRAAVPDFLAAAPATPSPDTAYLTARSSVAVFLVFAAAYFCSALVRAITATLAPVLTQEFALHARDLGLLAGGYFIGFAATQLPLGRWLDSHGPKRVILCFLALAVVACLAFSLATSFYALLAARVLMGMGVSACLMAPLTGYRRWLPPSAVLRANSWMLMTGALGMLTSTLPVHWLMPVIGWRPLFWLLALLFLVCAGLIAWVVPGWRGAPTRSEGAATPAARQSRFRGPGLEDAAPTLLASRSSLPPEGAAAPAARQSRFRGPGLEDAAPTLLASRSSLPPEGAAAPAARQSRFRGPGLQGEAEAPAADSGYAEVWGHAYFRRLSPLAFFNYGGMVAMQTLWAGPWMLRVAGYSVVEAATGLFCINAAMLATFWGWGMLNPWLNRQGWKANRLIAWCMPASLVVLSVNIALGSATGWVGWALFCVCSSVMGLAQPAVGMAFRVSLAGRAMSAYNLVIFAGVFVVQWGIGLLIDGFGAAGLGVVASFQAAMAVFLCCCIASYAYFMSTNADNSPQ